MGRRQRQLLWRRRKESVRTEVVWAVVPMETDSRGQVLRQLVGAWRVTVR